MANSTKVGRLKRAAVPPLARATSNQTRASCPTQRGRDFSLQLPGLQCRGGRRTFSTTSAHKGESAPLDWVNLRLAFVRPSTKYTEAKLILLLTSPK